MPNGPPKVFLSYSHDSDEHVRRVLGLSQRLREDGVDAWLDQYENGSPEEGWPRWMQNRLDWATFVLLVCSEIYYRRFRGREEPYRGKGADWEGQLITIEIYNAKSRTLKFVPILFDDQDGRFIPDPLQAFNYYLLDPAAHASTASYARLLAFLHGKAGVIPSRLGLPREIEHRNAEPLVFPRETKRNFSTQSDERIARLPGEYRIVHASNPGGKSGYSGRVSIRGQSHLLSVEWTTGSGKIDKGVAIPYKEVLGVGYGNGLARLAVYSVETDCTVGVRSVSSTLRAKAKLWTVTEPRRVEESTLWGSALPNDTYKLSDRSGGIVTIWPDGEIYAVRWDSPNYSYVGIGVKIGETLVVASGLGPGGNFGVVAYKIVEDRVLDGVWAIADVPGLGTEVLAADSSAQIGKS